VAERLRTASSRKGTAMGSAAYGSHSAITPYGRCATADSVSLAGGFGVFPVLAAKEDMESGRRTWRGMQGRKRRVANVTAAAAVR
jgi:hypothetical protein